MKLYAGLFVAAFCFEAFSAPTTLWSEGDELKRRIRNLPKQVFQRRPQARDPIVQFDYPIEYNSQIQYWIRHFQSSGRKVFSNWLKRSQKYMPHMQRILREEGLPTDLAYIPMIESGFIPHAVSPAKAVGPWQFISETGNRYGLETSWWLDERRDFEKSTRAAAKYLKYMYGLLNCWNLVAAGYNTGENRIIRLIEKHNTKSFWDISRSGDISKETQNYVPKLIATMLIAKSPEYYGFSRVPKSPPINFDNLVIPGGTRLDHLAMQAGVSKTELRDLNPELIRGYVPFHISARAIRIPPGTAKRFTKAMQAVDQMLQSVNNLR